MPLEQWHEQYKTIIPNMGSKKKGNVGTLNFANVMSGITI
jgi:hypothetical protein